jgi:hypothetical protein
MGSDPCKNLEAMTNTLGPLYTRSQGPKNLGPTLKLFWLVVWPQVTSKCWNICPKDCKLASQIWSSSHVFHFE